MDGLTPEIDNYLARIYYQPSSPASFYSAFKLWSYIKGRKDVPQGVNYKIIKAWLNSQTTHAIHTTPSKRFPTEEIIVDYPDMQWDADLLQLTNLSKYNKGYNYILVCIDLFSRYLWVRCLKTKTTVETAAACKEIFDEGRHPETLRTDQGREFLGKSFQTLLSDYSVSHMIAYGLHKASYAERVNRTIEDRLYKYFYENQTYNFIDVIDDVVRSYNNTIHSSIKVSPASVNETNSQQLFDRVYGPILDKRAKQDVVFSFEIGQLVRLSRAPSPFKRGYQEQYTEELFKISNRIPSHPPRYKVKDLLGETVQGSFYEAELQKVSGSDEDSIEYKVEKIISTKTINGVKHSLIKWYGYSPKFNSYIPSKDIKKYQTVKQSAVVTG